MISVNSDKDALTFIAVEFTLSCYYYYFFKHTSAYLYPRIGVSTLRIC